MTEFAMLYRNGKFEGYVAMNDRFEEKVANYIAAEPGNKIVTDMMDRTLVSTRGCFLDECSLSIRGRLMRCLTPLQMGDETPRALKFTEDADGNLVEKGSIRAWNKR